MLPLLAASLLYLGPAGQLDLQAGLRVASTARMVDEAPLADGSTPGVERRRLELDLEPRIILQNDARLHVRLSYLPTLRVPFEAAPPGMDPDRMPSAADRATWLHVAALDAEREVGRWTLRAGGRASHGVVEPYDRVLGPDEPVLTMERVPYQAYGASAGIVTSPWRRTTLEVGLAGSMAGGDGEVAQAAIPLYQEVRLDGSLDLEQGRRDLVGGRVGVAVSRVREADTIASRLGGRWRRELGRPTLLELSGGASMILGDFTSVGPWAVASLGYQPSPRLPSFSFALGLEPGIDRLMGAVHYRGSAQARAEWVPARSWELSAFGYGGVLEPWSGYEELDASRTWFGQLGLRAAYELGRHVSLAAGASSIWQQSGRSDMPSFREIAALLELHTVLIP